MRNSISGVLIFLSFIFTNIAYFFNDKIIILAGTFAWIAFLLLFVSLPKKKIIVPLIILSFCNFLFSYYNGFEIDFIKAIIVNHKTLQPIIENHATGYNISVKSPFTNTTLIIKENGKIISN